MLRRIQRFLAVAIIAASPIATLLAPGIAHAATFTCTWTGAVDNNFSTAGNWTGCNSSSPQVADTDDLVFPVTVTNFTPNNDLTGATFSSITFNGTSGGSIGYIVSGNSFTLAGNITDTSNVSNAIGAAMVINGATTITGGSNSLVQLNGTISGTGSITLAAGSAVVSDALFTGSVTVNAGLLQMQAASSSAPSFSGVTVASGATFGYDAFQSSGVSTFTFSAPINAAGGTLDFQTAGSGPYTLNLTGTTTLTGNTDVVVSSSTVVHVQGPLHGPGFKLTTNNSGAVLNESTDNTTATPSGDINPAAASDTSTPSTPDTGFAMVTNNPIASMAITVASAGAILAIARLSRKTVSRH